jgi:hypothetical protein
MWPVAGTEVPRVNGESSVQVDRGRWLYRFVLDADSIAIYRSHRSGQDLVPAEAWRYLAMIGVSDAFVLAVPGGWQPVVELADSRQRWPLPRRATAEEAQASASYFLATLADAVANASIPRGPLERGPEAAALRVPEPPPPPAEDPAFEAVYAQACAARQAEGWELVYSRQRAAR